MSKMRTNNRPSSTSDRRSTRREHGDVERVFAELGLLPDFDARMLAREAAPNRAERSAERRQTTTLPPAFRLLADAAPALAGDPELTARLVDRLEDALGITRAQIARELLGRPEFALLGPAFATETLFALVEGGERRLMRVGFDLHDGPLQELLLLAEDLRQLREQLLATLDERDERALVHARLDDLDTRLVALEAGLRRISTAVHASALTDRPFADALGELVDAFAARSGITPVVRVAGDSGTMSPSQRIALLSVVGEALNNVREHAQGAARAAVEVDFGADGIGARVVDDGSGFDVEQELVSAARRGRMGLAGIHERVRLLGGRCAIDSRPGGPTTVSLSLPRWQSCAKAPATAPASLDAVGR